MVNPRDPPAAPDSLTPPLAGTTALVEVTAILDVDILAVILALALATPLVVETVIEIVRFAAPPFVPVPRPLGNCPPCCPPFVPDPRPLGTPVALTKLVLFTTPVAVHNSNKNPNSSVQVAFPRLSMQV